VHAPICVELPLRSASRLTHSLLGPIRLLARPVPLFVAARPLHTTASKLADSPKKNPFSDVNVDPSKLIALSNEIIKKLQSQTATPQRRQTMDR
jgi:hypothetical protein